MHHFTALFNCCLRAPFTVIRIYVIIILKKEITRGALRAENGFNAMKKKKLLVIDGNSILNRAFYGIRPLTNKDGLFTHAVYGMANMVLKQFDALRPDAVCVAFDVHAPTFRHKANAQYKANRHGMPEELAVQLPYAKELMRALGYLVIEAPGYEADDILGTMSRKAADTGMHAYLFTGDRDSFQLINDSVSVIFASTKSTEEYTPALFTEKYGISPAQLVDVKALMGDSSDNISGVRGIGEKTAYKLIADFGSLDNLYENYRDSSLSASVKNKLESGKEDAYSSAFLAKIVTDAPISASPDDAEYKGPDMQSLRPLLTKLELFSLADRLSAPGELDKVSESHPCEYTASDARSLDKGKRYGLYTDGKTTFIACETQHIQTGTENILPLLADADYKFTVCDKKALCRLAGEKDIKVRADLFDVPLAAYVINSTGGDFSLESIAATYLEGNMSDPADELYRLYAPLSALLKDSGSEYIYYSIESPCAEVLAQMETDGFKIDVPALTEYSHALGEAADSIADDIYAMAGEKFNINSPKQLGSILFDKLLIPYPKKSKKGYSTSAEILDTLRPFYPIVDKILDYRQLTKLNSTYAVGLCKAADPDGTVHTTFRQTVTATGRLSSTEPNLQNIPIKTELGRHLRKFFIPKSPGRVLVDADYSQIELRLLAHISGDENMTEAFKSGVDIHTVTASKAFGVPEDMVTPELRKRAKAVNFGIIYGMSDFSLAQDIGVSKREAAEYIKAYMATYPRVAEYLDRVVKEAKEKGYVTTMMGRRRYIPELSSGKAMIRKFGERVAMNSPIQGTAADIMKLAMVRVYSKLQESGIDAHLILQVHDELVLDADGACADRAAEILKSEMENVCELSIPLTAQTTIGETWYENK